MKGLLFKLSLDKQGTHPIQAVIEIPLTDEEEDFITEELKGHFGVLASVFFALFIYLP